MHFRARPGVRAGPSLPSAAPSDKSKKSSSGGGIASTLGLKKLFSALSQGPRPKLSKSRSYSVEQLQPPAPGPAPHTSAPRVRRAPSLQSLRLVSPRGPAKGHEARGGLATPGRKGGQRKTGRMLPPAPQGEKGEPQRPHGPPVPGGSPLPHPRPFPSSSPLCHLCQVLASIADHSGTFSMAAAILFVAQITSPLDFLSGLFRGSPALSFSRWLPEWSS